MPPRPALSPALRLRVLGAASLEHPQGVLTLERKTAGVLAYLALEGQTARSKLAGLLWPDSGEGTARNNLAQLLRRLRQHVSAEVIVPGNALRLAGGVEADAAQLKALAFAGEGGALAFSGELLAAYDYDDLPEFSEWLWGERERLLTAVSELRLTLASRAEAQGRPGEALKHAQALLEQDPISEAAHRLVMRLHYLAGDRAAALRAYRRCEAVLSRELGVAPLPETTELAGRIERGALPTPRPPAPGGAPPLEAAALVGRETAWAALTRACEEAPLSFVSGEPGAGKSRLSREFAASRGSYLHLEGRPGDEAVPFAFQTRLLRALLERVTGGALAAPHPASTDLPAWVLQELARVLPELAPETPAPGLALTTDVDRVRLFEATRTLLARAGERVQTVILDDLQFIDAASAEVCGYLFSQLAFPPPTAPVASTAPDGLRVIGCFRRGELAEGLQGTLDGLLERGAAHLVVLSPLAEADVATLLRTLPGGAERLAPDLLRYTGGNPLYLVETLRHLLESGGLAGAFPARLPPPGRVSSLLRRRLGRLSPLALRALQAAATLQSDFDLALAAQVVKVDALELIGAWSELETGGFVQGARFGHDLIYEAVLTTLAPPVQALLHARAAEALEAVGAAPARVAAHYLAGGDTRRAVPPLLEAARAAETAYRWREAVDFYARAAELLEAQGETAGAFRALFAQVELLSSFDAGERLRAVVEGLTQLASTDAQRARAWGAQAYLDYTLGDFAALERSAAAALAHAEAAADPSLMLVPLEGLGLALHTLGRTEAARPVGERFLRTAEALGDLVGQAKAQQLLGLIHNRLDQKEAAEARLREADALFVRAQRPAARAGVLIKRAQIAFERGRIGAMEGHLLDAKALLEKTDGLEDVRAATAYGFGRVALAAERYTKAQTLLEAGLSESAQGAAAALFHLALSDLWSTVGAFRAAHDEAERARRAPGLPDSYRLDVLVAALTACAGLGDDPAPLLEEAEAYAATHDHNAYDGCALLLAKARVAPAAERLALAETVRHRAASCALEGVAAAGALRAAEALLELGRPQAARGASEAALELLQQATPPLPRILFLRAHARILAALRDPEAASYVRASEAWVREVSPHVPEAHRERFWALYGAPHLARETAG